MCRIFRHYMDDNDQLGEKRNISVGIIDRNGKNIQPDVFLKANDLAISYPKIIFQNMRLKLQMR